MGLDDFHHQFDDRARREKLAADLALAHGEIGQKVFVNLAKQVTTRIQRNVRKYFQQALRQPIVLRGAGEAKVFVLRQHAGQLRLVFLNSLHGFFESIGDVFLLGQVQQVAVAGVVGQVEAALPDGDAGQLLFTPSTLEFLVFGQDGGFNLETAVDRSFPLARPHEHSLLYPRTSSPFG